MDGISGSWLFIEFLLHLGGPAWMAYMPDIISPL